MMMRSWSGLTFMDFDSQWTDVTCVDRTRVPPYPLPDGGGVGGVSR